MSTSAAYANAISANPFTRGLIECVMPPTLAQREIWLSVAQGDDASRAFNEAIEIVFDGQVKIDALQTALNRLNERHQSLRSVFSPSGDRMLVLAHQQRSFDPYDLRLISAEQLHKELVMFRQQSVAIPFDLTNGPLWHARIIRTPGQTHLLMTVHHIIADGWSLAVALDELSLLYREQVLQKDQAIPPAVSFSEYVRYCEEYRSSDELNTTKNYWSRRFSGSIPTLDLPTDKPRPALRTYTGARIDIPVEPATLEKIRQAAASQGLTLFTWMLAAYYVLVYRISGQDDLVVGIPSAGQSAAGFDHLIGHCVNMLPLRQCLNEAMPFHEFARALSSDVLDAREHEHFTFSELLSQMNIPRDRSRVPLVAVTFNIDQESHGLDFGPCTANYHSIARQYENFEWFFNIGVRPDRMVVECSYNEDLFTHTNMLHRVHEYIELLSFLAQQPDCTLANTPIWSELDQTLLDQVNNTFRPLPETSAVIDLIELSAQANADKIALICGDEQYTHLQVQQQANQLANRLVELGITDRDIVALCVPRSAHMLISLLAIRKLGAAYLPLDADFPAERLSYIINDARAALLIGDTDMSGIAADSTRVLLLEDWWQTSAQHPITAPVRDYRPEACSYVLYTSGSTGKPKGVQVSHRNELNFLLSMQREPGIQASDRLLAVTTISFDISLLELFLPLLAGATVVIAQRETTMDPAALAGELHRHNITILQATPTAWRALLNSGWRGSRKLKALVGGEAMGGDMLEPLLSRTAQIWNLYGPTETTVWSTCTRIQQANSPVRIGRPIDNTSIHILDTQLRPVAIGCEGELYIGGTGVSLGYLHKAEQTAERFVYNPFASRPDGKLYCTGDLCKLHGDGELEYISRMDNQIKLRGFRIELGEIELVLAAHPNVSQCVALVETGSTQEGQLIAYCQSIRQPLDGSELRCWARRQLPDYMLPQNIVVLDELPRTPNGKIDRARLPNQDETPPTIQNNRAPRTSTEKLIAASWRELIGEVKPCVDNNFFDIGGYSLLAMRFIREMRNHFSTRITLRALLGDTLEQIAAAVNPADKVQPEPLPAAISSAEIKPAQSTSNGVNLPANIPAPGRATDPANQQIQVTTSDFQAADTGSPELSGSATIPGAANQTFTQPAAPPGLLRARYLNSKRGRILTYLHSPAAGHELNYGVLVCPPIGHEYMRSQRALRQVAVDLARQGYHVMRFDYYGIGDSEGGDHNASLDDWRQDIQTAWGGLGKVVDKDRMSMLGFRMGASLAATSMSLSCRKLVLLDPIINGKDWLNNLNRMHEMMLRDLDRFRWRRKDARLTRRVELLGFNYAAALQNEIAGIDLTQCEIQPHDSLHILRSSGELNAFAETSTFDSGQITFHKKTNSTDQGELALKAYTSDSMDKLEEDYCWSDLKHIETTLLPYRMQKIINKRLLLRENDA